MLKLVEIKLVEQRFHVLAYKQSLANSNQSLVPYKLAFYHVQLSYWPLTWLCNAF